MSPTLQLAAPPAPYMPLSDVLDRHEYGVNKNRKTASTGGGRAWSEDEESYLLQTRLQKMPYKHIAAHLKKTELACRLHFHQLSHGSNRRKRTTSVSSGSSTGGHSPIMCTSIPSPIHEHDHGITPSRSCSPPGSAGSTYGSGSPIQLPAILGALGSSHGHGATSSPRLPAILPKHASMTLALATPVSAASVMSSTSFPTPISDSHPHSAPLHLQSGFPLATPTSSTIPAPLRLDCSAFPPPPPGLASAGIVMPSAVDMGRLGAAYATHRATFWAAIAADYGTGVSPLVLEHAWRGGYAASSSANAGTGPTSAAMQHHQRSNECHQHANMPMTPMGSPEGPPSSASCDGYSGLRGLGLGLAMNVGIGLASQQSSIGQAQSQQQQGGDKTRISAILGIDANPRSPKEREMVRRMEEGRIGVVAASA